MKGILLAGGAGSRLYPLTEVACKQLVPVYDKPMVYYPLTTLIDGGVRELCLISTPVDLPRFQRLFGDGSRLGLRIGYREQARPAGIAEALLIAEDFVGEDSVALILGDNVFYAGDALARAFRDYASGATIFGYQVKNPERYGVVELDDAGRVLSIEEKPARPKSNHAIPGLYLFDARAPALARQLRPSARGELEITDLNRLYLARGELAVEVMSRGMAWLDAGTHESLLEAASFVHAIQRRTGLMIACPEEIAWRMGFIDRARLAELAAELPDDYGAYLRGLAAG